MNSVETNGESLECEWDTFGIGRTDFNPHWDGDLVNVFTSVNRLETEDATEEMMRDCALRLAQWILDNRSRFGFNDRFQIIIGWSLKVRKTARQTIKTGGTYEDLSKIISGEKAILMCSGWSKAVFS